MSDMTDEEYVRAHWKCVVDQAFVVYLWADSFTPGHRFAGLIGKWPEARAFTEHRLEQIRQVEEEIVWIKGSSGHTGECTCCVVRDRVLAAREQVLADLKRGMK